MIKTTVKLSQFQIIANENSQTNQAYWTIEDKATINNRNVGGSWLTYEKAEQYLLDTGLINCRSLYPSYIIRQIGV